MKATFIPQIKQHGIFVTSITVTAKQYANDAQWTTDWGIARVRAGQWVVEADGYWRVWDNDEFAKNFKLATEEESNGGN